MKLKSFLNKTVQQPAVEAPKPEAGDSKSRQFIKGLVDGVNDDYLMDKNKRDALNHHAQEKEIRVEAAMQFGRWMQEIDPCKARKSSLHLMHAPGFRFVAVLTFLCRNKTAKEVIKPMHDDFLYEFYSELNAGHRVKATWLCAQMHFNLAAVAISDPVAAALKWIWGAIPVGKSGK